MRAEKGEKKKPKLKQWQPAWLILSLLSSLRFSKQYSVSDDIIWCVSHKSNCWWFPTTKIKKVKGLEQQRLWVNVFILNPMRSKSPSIFSNPDMILFIYGSFKIALQSLGNQGTRNLFSLLFASHQHSGLGIDCTLISFLNSGLFKPELFRRFWGSKLDSCVWETSFNPLELS